MHTRILFVAGALLPSWICAASPLSDSQLYFDPASLEFGDYGDVDAPLGGPISWFGTGGREIVGANILPPLRNQDYGPGHVYGQSDYETQPNLGPGFYTYAASLTSGTLTAQFDEEGIYHVRVNYSDNTSEIHSVFVATGIAGKQGQDKNNKTGKTKVTQTKAGDVVYISTGNADDGAMTNAKELFAGLTIVRVATVAEIASDLETRSAAAGRKLDAVIVGHGYEGSIRLGKEGDPAAQRINNNGAATSTSGTNFGNAIKDFARSVNLAGCSTGGQAAGGQLLRDIETTGVRATAYTSSVYYGTTKMYIDHWGTKVPTPGSLALIGIAGLALARRHGRA